MKCFSREEGSRKRTRQQKYGDEQLLLLRLLAGMVLHEIRMLRGIFNENDNYCQLVVRIFSYMTGKGDSGHQSFADGLFSFR
ncbi:hypothetical protein SNB70_01560 [Escherichia coli]|nr:hypothetical protein SNB70_01560 [Escherichia coli]